MAASEIVKLNVGGQRFYTTRRTLLPPTRPNFFHGLLDGRLPAVLDEGGCYFIDRSPKYFECVLQYLRSGTWDGPREALEEARFYGIEVNVMEAVTDEYLIALADSSRLAELIKWKDGIAALMERITPMLVHAVKSSTLLAPTVVINVLPDIESLVDECEKTLSGISRKPPHFSTKEQARQALAWLQTSAGTVLSDLDYQVINGVRRVSDFAALELYIKDTYKITLHFDISTEFALYARGGHANCAFGVRVGRKAFNPGIDMEFEAATLPCFRIAWHAKRAK
jgi:hypothetical protein